MRLRFFRLQNYPPLTDIAINFSAESPLQRQCQIHFVVGVNGTGRAAYGNFEVTVNGTRVSLANVDPVQQNRLNNFDQLVKLTQRWWEEYKSQKTSYLKKLADKARRRRIQPTAKDILDTIEEWLKEIAAENTRMPHSIMRRVVLERVQTTESPDFDGWLKHAEEALP